MKKTIFTILIFLLPVALFAQWVNNIGGTTNNFAGGIAVDGSGNSYVTGFFQGTTDFDPGVGTTNLTSFGGSNTYFAKYASDGTLIWANNIGGGANLGYDIAVDVSGNSYVTGHFFDIVDFDPGPGITNLTSQGTEDIYLAKYASDGTFVWANSMGGNSFDRGEGIAVDGSGNSYVTGFFQDTVDFDPGPGATNLISAGNFDVFFAKYASDGALVWANSIGNTNEDKGEGIAVDGNGNAYITGFFIATVDFDPGPGIANLNSAGSYDVFLAKYASDGTLVWANNIGGTDNDRGRAITVDGSGNSYITGYFQGTVDFDPGPGTTNLTSSAGNYDVYFAKYASDGTFIWANSIFNIFYDRGLSIAVDGDGNSYIIGKFINTVDFDPRTGIANLTSAGGADIYFAKYASDGTFIWANGIGGNGADYGWDISVDGSGNTYITGDYNGKADFDPGPGIANYSSNGGRNVFVAKYGPDGVFTDVDEIDYNIPKELELSQNYPNPFNPSTKISWQSPVSSHQTIKVYDVLGNEVATLVNEYREAGSHELIFDASNLTSGIYFYQLQAGNFLQTKKMILIK